MFIPLHDGNALKHIRLQYVTLIIIAANCLIWLLSTIPAVFSADAARATVFAYGFIPAVVNGYEVLPDHLDRIPAWSTYLTYAFFHGDFWHLAGNMLFVWVFGDNVEDAMGHFRFILFYLACAVIAALAHSLIAPQSPVPLIGASGAAAGIIGAYLLLHPKIRIWVLALGRIPIRIPAAFVLIAWFGFQIYQFLFDVNQIISWAAHIGGFIAGMVLILFLRRPGVALLDRPDEVIIPDPTGPDAEAPTGPPKRTSVPVTGRKPIRWGRGGTSDPPNRN